MKVSRTKKGQSLVEFAIILPLLLLVVMGIIEFGLMLNSYLTINNASREGARAGIVGNSDVDIRNLILTTSPSLKATDLIIDIVPSEEDRKSGNTLTVTVNYDYQLTVPIISGLLQNVVKLNAQTSMRIE